MKPTVDLTAALAEAGARISAATEALVEGGLTDGAHHKQHAIDQALRVLWGDGYASMLRSRGCVVLDWDTGIAP